MWGYSQKAALICFNMQELSQTNDQLYFHFRFVFVRNSGIFEEYGEGHNG